MGADIQDRSTDGSACFAAYAPWLMAALTTALYANVFYLKWATVHLALSASLCAFPIALIICAARLLLHSKDDEFFRVFMTGVLWLTIMAPTAMLIATTIVFGFPP